MKILFLIGRLIKLDKDKKCKGKSNNQNNQKARIFIQSVKKFVNSKDKNIRRFMGRILSSENVRSLVYLHKKLTVNLQTLKEVFKMGILSEILK
uniref:Uncharacterized protein n=1 Tax=Meloidogyne enterolobii TaxID=390850 RepID=A0A6V7UB12_MELEN|nr:unnamed protein product [Meloidogyne enterolobii]